ncbi:MAG TPA: hypothetical protein VF416_10965 [Marmoricola sp.]
MSAAEGRPDLAAIAAEAEVERETAVAVEQQAPSDEPMALAISELGYYEAELSSLRDAAVTLDEAEHS